MMRVKQTGESESVLPLLFMVFGLLMVLGGIGYLVYLYRFSSSSSSAFWTRGSGQVAKGESGGIGSGSEKGLRLASSMSSKDLSGDLEREPEQKGGLESLSGLGGLKEKFLRLRQSKQKSKRRRGVFSSFDTSSSSIPHIDKLLEAADAGVREKTGLKGSLKGSQEHQEKVAEIAKMYADHREEIEPGLKPAEKGVFGQLAGLAQKSEGRDVKEIISPARAKDIFSQLKDISKKRKKKDEK